ncbi:Hsp70 family protein [Actinoplanes sp. CA-030573]|uniref:Hsp70 family protein n=1 Tax=Actinoplanes sp. CA-030573 TaxID=3239898 RepID=UPI003D8F1860
MLVQADGAWRTLTFPGGPLSSAVHVSGAGITVGAQAWAMAGRDPDGFVVSPLRLGTGEITVGGRQVEVADLVAATLRHVMEHAAGQAGQPPADVRMAVPAGWGPRRRTWLRHAAHRAGLPAPQLIEAPVAAARLLADPGSIERPVLVVDVGAGCEVTVVAAGPSGPEVVATLADAKAGGDQVDAALAAVVLTGELDAVPPAQRWPLLAVLRAAKRSLADQPAVTVVLPGTSVPRVVDATELARVAHPVLDHIADLAKQVVGNADLSVEQVGAVHLIGASAALPETTAMLSAKLGVKARLASPPESAAVLGAIEVHSNAPAARGRNAVAAAMPPLRRLAALSLSGLFSLILYAHFVFSAEFNNGHPDRLGPGYYVLASWGELVIAAVLAAITFLQSSAVIAALLHQQPDLRSRGTPEGQITAGLLLAAAAGPAVAALYAITAAVYFAYPIGALLRWTLLPVVPIATVTAVIAVLAWRRSAAAQPDWDAFLAFPVTAVVAVSMGIAALSFWWHGGLPAWAAGWSGPCGFCGGLLLGAAIACTLARHLGVRVLLALVLSFFTVIISRSGPSICAVLFAVAVTYWVAQRASLLLRAHADPLPA